MGIYFRLCVAVKSNVEIPTEIDLTSEFGDSKQATDRENKTSLCPNCKSIAHDTERCFTSTTVNNFHRFDQAEINFGRRDSIGETLTKMEKELIDLIWP